MVDFDVLVPSLEAGLAPFGLAYVKLTTSTQCIYNFNHR